MILELGILFSVVAIGCALGIVGYGLLNRADEDVAAFLQRTGAVVGFMAVAGVAIGGAGYFSINWILETAELGPPIDGVLSDVAPLIALLILFLVGTAISVVLGLSEGAKEVDRTRALGTALSTLIGAVFLVLFAAIIISTTTTSDEISAYELFAISGLVAVVSSVGSTAAMAISDRRTAASA